MKSKSKTPSGASVARRLPRLPRGGKTATFRRAALLSAVVGMGSLGLALPLRADTITWQGGDITSPTLWEVANNWLNISQFPNTNQAPTTGDDVYNSTNLTIDYLASAGTSAINSLTNNGGGTINFNLSDAMGQSFTVTGDVTNVFPSVINVTGVAGNAVTFSSAGAMFNNNSTITTGDGGTLNIGTLFSYGVHSNSGVIEADGTGVGVAPTIHMYGDSLQNNYVIQAKGGNGAALTMDYNSITNTGVISSAQAGSTLTINQNYGGTLTNNYLVGAGYGGILYDYSNTVNNNAYSDNIGNSLGYSASQGGQIYFFGQSFVNGDGGFNPGWVHSFSNSADGSYVRIDGDISNSLNSHITAEDSDAGFSTIDLNITHGYLYNAGTIEALKGSSVRSYASYISNLNSGIIVADGSNALNTNVNTQRQSAVFLGDDQSFDNVIPYLYNQGQMLATNGGQFYATVQTLDNTFGGLISAQGLDSTTNSASSVVLGNYANSTNIYYPGISTLTNNGEISALNGGNLTILMSNSSTLDNYNNIVADGGALDTNGNYVQSQLSAFGGTVTNHNGAMIQATNGGAVTINDTFYHLPPNYNPFDSAFYNEGSVVADGLGVSAQTFDPGLTTTTYTPSTVTLNATRLDFLNSSITNSGSISAINGGVVNIFYFTPFVNTGTLTSDGGGATTNFDYDDGSYTHYFAPSQLSIGSGAFYSATSVNGDFINDSAGHVNVTNGGVMSISPLGDFLNNGSVLVDGHGVDNEYFDGSSSQFQYRPSAAYLTASAWDFQMDSVNAARGGTFTNANAIDVTNGGQLTISAFNGLINSGTINVSGNAPYDSFGDTIPSELFVSSYRYQPMFTPQVGGDITNSGHINVFNGGILSLYAANDLTNTLSGAFNFDSSAIGALTVNNNFTNSGAINNSGNSMLDLQVNGAFTNNGDIKSGSGATFNGVVYSDFLNTAGATLEWGEGEFDANGLGFTNAGTIHTEGGTLTFNFADAIDNSGVIDVRLNSGQLFFAGNTLTNSGNFGTSAGATLNGTIEGDFNNTGTGSVQWETGTLTLNNLGGTFVNDGYLHTEGGTLSILNPTSIVNTGNIDVRLNTGVLYLNTANSLLNSGSIGTSAGATMNASVGGDFTNTVTGAINFGAGTFNTNTIGGVFLNDGILHTEGGAINVVNATDITNSGELSANNPTSSISLISSGAFTNSGLVNTDFGATLNGTIEGDFTNSGTINNRGGGTLTVNHTGGIFTNSGVLNAINSHINATSATSITNSNSINAYGTGSLDLHSTGAFTNSGDVYAWDSSAVTVTADSLFNDTAGYIAGAGGLLTLNVTGSNLVNKGQIYGFGSTLALNAAGATLDNQASGTVAGTRPGGTLTATLAAINNAGSLGSSIGGHATYNVNSFTNSGTLRSWYDLPSDPTVFGAGADTTVNNVNALSNTGTILVQKGTTMTITGGVVQTGASSRTQIDGGAGMIGAGLLTVGSPGLTLGTMAGALGSGGTLAGNGTVVGDVYNLSGVVAPGASPGLMTIMGDYIQGPNGMLDIQIDGLTPGTEFDVLSVFGNVNLDGGVNFDFDSGFMPMAGQSFNFLQFTGTQTGMFDSSKIHVMGLSGLTYTLLDSNGNISILLAPTAAVPEPSALMVFGAAGIGLFLAGRRRVRK